MKTYKTQAEVEKDIENGVLTIEGNVTFKCSISIDASINIIEGDINALDINALNIKAQNIKARDINAWNINAQDINALDINALDINAWNINALNINAWNINALYIKYYAFCCVYQDIKCVSITATRKNNHKPICLDGKLQFKKQK